MTAYLRGDGEADTVLDPVEFWRDTVSDPGGGLQVKITGGAGYAADAIEVFTSINGTLLLAAVSLVIFLLIVIYRSPIFFFIPLAAVMFAEILARSAGYGLSELGVTINGQSSSIMSILVLGAGTDYALLIVARYREELHHTARPSRGHGRGHALRRPGRARLGRHRDRGPLLPADREGQRHVGHGADRRDGRRLRGAVDAHAPARAAHDLRPACVLAVRAAFDGLDGARGRHVGQAPPPHRRRVALAGRSFR